VREAARRNGLAERPEPRFGPTFTPTSARSHVKRGLGNLIVHGLDQLVAVVKNRLKRIQYRPELIDAFLAHTGLNLEPP
jgi:hypothetical protein